MKYDCICICISTSSKMLYIWVHKNKETYTTQFLISFRICNCYLCFWILLTNQFGLIQSEAIIIWNMPPSSTRWGIFIILSTATPSFLPIDTSSIWSIILVIPFIHYHSRAVAPLSVNPLVRRRQRK